MPTFGRLGKHSNRSQHAVTDAPPLLHAPPATSGPAPGGGSGGGPGDGAATAPATAASATVTAAASEARRESLADAAAPHQLQQQQQQQSLRSSNESFVDARSSQQQQSGSLPAHYPLYQQPPSLLQNPPAAIGASPSQQQHQQHQQPADFDTAGVIQHSQRYSSLPQNQQQQQHHLYSASTTSLDDFILSSSSNAPAPPPPQQAPTPEKRSTRRLIKGIFSGRSNHDGGRDNSQGHSAAGSYDNTGGLARRPSKRVSRSSSSRSSPQQPSPSPSPSSSPLRDAGDAAGGYNRAEGASADRHRRPPQDSRIIAPIKTIREVAAIEEVPSSYDEAVYYPSSVPHPPPNQQQAPPLQQHPAHVQLLASHDPQPQQQQQLRYDAQRASYDHNHPSHPPSPPQQQQQQYYAANPAHDPRIVSSHQGTAPQQQQQQQQNPEIISQLSQESLAIDAEQRSLNLQLDQPSPAAPVPYSAAQNQDLASNPTPPSNQQPAMMAPPPGGGPPANRRNLDTEKALPGPPSGYRQGNNTSMIPQSPLTGGSSQPGPSGQPGAQNQAFRGDRAPQYDAASGEQGRSSPQPSTQERDAAESDKAFKELLIKYKNVKRLYFDGKTQIEQLTGQVEHLQNAVANQRMSQSRTALDDNEYVNRFNRLNGAINNLAFNIRKDWRCVPQWLDKLVSPDALKTGKQEMTAVGRAVISRWVVEEIFNKCFHPDLDWMLSAQLKEVELSIRGNAYTMHSQEEFDALTTKVVNWRMATLDGLQQKLNSPSTADNRASLIAKATTNLTAQLYQYLNSPPPPGVESSTSMLVELAVNIAASLPLESRDVSIMHPLPGDVLQPNLMEVEKAGLPALEGQKPEGPAEAEAEADKDKNDSGGLSKIRFAGFVALEVRGRQVLMKAPVWTL